MEDGEEAPRGTPNTKDAVKSLTTQRDSIYSRLGSVRESPRMTPRYRPSGYFPPESSNHYYNAGSSTYTSGGPKREMSYMEPSRTTTSSRDEASVSISNASDIESEWIEEDEPGVYITIRQLVDGTRELRRVRFSRERFGEVNAKQWWETNRDRIQAQKKSNYLILCIEKCLGHYGMQIQWLINSPAVTGRTLIKTIGNNLWRTCGQLGDVGQHVGAQTVIEQRLLSFGDCKTVSMARS
ncbi:UNVERIFIED_CONTAM: Protein Brevis radix-like 1 [Sesamum indicum]